jgi:hypothetical protein
LSFPAPGIAGSVWKGIAVMAIDGMSKSEPTSRQDVTMENHGLCGAQRAAEMNTFISQQKAANNDRGQW